VPHNWLQWGLRGSRELRGIIEKVAEGEGKGENERERKGGGTRKGNRALVVGDIRLCQCILGFTKHFWLIDNLICYNSVIQRSWVDLTSSGGGEDFPPCPNLETVCVCGRPCAVT